MAIDARRIAVAAVEAAFDQVEESNRTKRKRRGLPAKRALLMGAALVTMGRVAWASRGRGLIDSLEQRLSDVVDGGARDDEDVEREEDFEEQEGEEEPEAYDDEDDQPEDFEDEENGEELDDSAEGNDDLAEAEDGDAGDEGEGEDSEEDSEEETGERRRPRANSRAKRGG